MKFEILIALCVAISCSKSPSSGDSAGNTENGQNTGSKGTEESDDGTEKADTDPIDTSPSESETSSSSATESNTQEYIETESSASEPTGTATATSSESSEHELLYALGGDLYALEADDTHLYAVSMGGIFRLKKDGSGEPEILGSVPSGQLHQAICLDEQYAYWLLGENIVKLDKNTLESTMLSLEGHHQDFQVLTGDEQGSGGRRHSFPCNSRRTFVLRPSFPSLFPPGTPWDLTTPIPTPKVIFSESQRWGDIQAVLAGDWKLVFNRKSTYHEIYNLKNDPDKTTNLMDDDIARFETLNQIRREFERKTATSKTSSS